MSKRSRKNRFSQLRGAEKELSENLGCAGYGLMLGLVFWITPVTQMAWPKEGQTRHLNGWGHAGLLLGGLTVSFSTWGAVSSIMAAKKIKQKRLREAFFELVAKHHGRISLMMFSRAVDIDGDEAEAYLNDRAKEFHAFFEPIENGGVNYLFNRGIEALDRDKTA